MDMLGFLVFAPIVHFVIFSIVLWEVLERRHVIFGFFMSYVVVLPAYSLIDDYGPRMRDAEVEVASFVFAPFFCWLAVTIAIWIWQFRATRTIEFDSPEATRHKSFLFLRQACATIRAKFWTVIPMVLAIVFVAFVVGDIVWWIASQIPFLRHSSYARWIVQLTIKWSGAVIAIWVVIFLTRHERPTELAESLFSYTLGKLKPNLQRLLKSFGWFFLRVIALAVVTVLIGKLMDEVFWHTNASDELVVFAALLYFAAFVILAMILAVRYVFIFYMVFEPNIQPKDMPRRSTEIGRPHFWAILRLYLSLSVVLTGIQAIYGWTASAFPKILHAGRVHVSLWDPTGPSFLDDWPYALWTCVIFSMALTFRYVLFYHFYERVQTNAPENAPAESTPANEPS